MVSTVGDSEDSAHAGRKVKQRIYSEKAAAEQLLGADHELYRTHYSNLSEKWTSFSVPTFY